MSRLITFLLAVVMLTGCSNFVIPEVQADKVDCNYHRELNDITWDCQLEGTGQPSDFGLF